MSHYSDEYFIIDSVTDECIGSVEAFNAAQAVEIAKELFPGHPEMYAITRNGFFS